MTDTTPPAPQPEADDGGPGILSLFGILIGGGCILFGGAGAINTAFDLGIVLRVYGSRTELPDTYEASVALVLTGVLFIGLSLFGSFVARKFREARGKPLVRALIVLGAVALLVVAGRGLQIAALTHTYGSMLAYYATDGDLDDVRAELAKDPDREALDRAVGRAAQYDNAPALKLLMEHGADMRGKGLPKERRRCQLRGTGPEFIEVAIEHGVTPKTCPESDDLIWYAVFDNRDDDKQAARIIKLLADAGWSPTAHKKNTDSPLEFARKNDLPRTVKLLEELPKKKKKRRKKKKKKASKDK